MLRRLLQILVFGEFIFLAALAVLFGGYAVSRATGDTMGPTVLWWAAMICLVLFLIDLILVIGVLGIESLTRSSDGRDPPRP